MFMGELIAAVLMDTGFVDAPTPATEVERHSVRKTISTLSTNP